MFIETFATKAEDIWMTSLESFMERLWKDPEGKGRAGISVVHSESAREAAVARTAEVIWARLRGFDPRIEVVQDQAIPLSATKTDVWFLVGLPKA